MVKHIAWNNVKLKLPRDWEVTVEGGSRLNGFITVAPAQGCKLEVYWKRGCGDYVKNHEGYIRRLVKRGFKPLSRSNLSVAGHDAVVEHLVRGGDKVFVSTWCCSSSNRLFIAQLDGPEASRGLFIDLIVNLSCHTGLDGPVDWRLLGLGLKLYRDYFVVDREFRVGYSMGYFVSNDRKVQVLQYAIPAYAVESIDLGRVRERNLKLLVPRFTKLVEVERGVYTVYAVKHVLFNSISYGYLLERVVECRNPDYKQFTLVKTVKGRLDEAREIAVNVYCSEW